MFRKVAVVLVAWAVPVAWAVATLLSGPSDATVVTSPSGTFGAGSPVHTVTVTRTYGSSQLAEGDRILTVDGVPVETWLAERPHLERGDSLTYRVRRPAAGLDRIVEVPVELRAYPVGAALAANPAPVGIAVASLAAASFFFWRRPRDAACRALLVAAATLPAAFTAYPLGPGPAGLAGPGASTALAGQLVACVGLGAVLGFALVFPQGIARGRASLVAWVAAGLVPFLGYGAWLLLQDPVPADGPADLQARLTVLAPALAVTVPGCLVAQAMGLLRTGSREDRVARRLLAVAAVVVLVCVLLLWFLPLRLTDQALVRGDLLALLLTPVVLACLGVAVLRYRLTEIDWTLRRSLLQLLAIAVVGSALLGSVAAVNVAAGNSFRSMLVGAMVATVMLPLVATLRRVASRLAYGERATPERVVARLRRLEPRTAPEQTLQEMLGVLSRSLRLSWAAVELDSGHGGAQVRASSGVPRGEPTSVVLQVAGTTVGRLQLEVDPSREPFRARDQRLLEDIGSHVGAVVQAIAVNQELQHARERLVAAREEERRRVRRDLHDGLGPSLAGMVLKLEAAQELIDRDPDRASTLVSQLTEQARAEIVEIRHLVDGLRPPALDQLGLVSALRQRADEHNSAVRSRGRGPTWTVLADDHLEPLPAAAEVAAFRIVDEAVNNAVRHSGADSCTVRLRRNGTHLLIEVHDTGAWLPAARTAGLGIGGLGIGGLGIGSMRDRAEELGGTFGVESDERGTRVVVRLPLTPVDGGAG